MNRLKTRVSVFLLLITSTLTVAAGCNKPVPPRAMEAKEAFGMLRNDFAVIVDLREADEITNGTAQGARWFPFTSKIEKATPEAASQATSSWIETLPKDKLIVLYCRTGRRSGLAADLLSKKGYRTANLGAFETWEKAGLPVQPFTGR